MRRAAPRQRLTLVDSIQPRECSTCRTTIRRFFVTAAAALTLVTGVRRRHGRARGRRQPVRARPGPDRRRPRREPRPVRHLAADRVLAERLRLRRRRHLLPDQHQPTGTFGAVAISPGFTAYWSSISWLGPRIASHGFVVIGIETNTTLDQPACAATSCWPRSTT